MAHKALVPFLVAMMLLTGVCNTLLTKYQDNQCVRNCDDPDPKLRKTFEQPVLQTAQMFVGEAACWLVVGMGALWRKTSSRLSGYRPVKTNEAEADDDEAAPGVNGEQAPLIASQSKASPSVHPSGELTGWRVLLLALPAICDIIGTTLMNVGLMMVAASIYQMTRGALVLFVGIFSVVFLRRHLYLFHWVSLVGVVLGVAVVGLAGAIFPDAKAKATDLATLAADNEAVGEALRVVLGVVLIAAAQIFTATQFVLEEYLLERSTIAPLEVVGWEGIFGLSVTIIVMIVLHFTVGTTDAGRFGMFDMVEGLRQMSEYKAVLVSSLLIMVSIGGFNFFGLSVTRSVSATSRSTIDTCRTLFIWVVSLGLGWESFKWLQVVGFALLVYFTFLFNGIVRPPFKFLQPREDPPELLPEEPIEHI